MCQLWMLKCNFYAFRTMAENDRKVWVKTMCSITATRITISGDADILEVVKAAKKRIHCLEDVSEDMVTVLCNGKSVSKSLKVDSALEEGIGVSDMSEAVLVLNLSEGKLHFKTESASMLLTPVSSSQKTVWVRCEWNSAVTRIMVSPDAKIADVVEAAVKKMKCMSIETEDVVTVACRGKELSKSQTVQSALKEGLGLSDKNDEVLVLQASEGTIQFVVLFLSNLPPPPPPPSWFGNMSCVYMSCVSVPFKTLCFSLGQSRNLQFNYTNSDQWRCLH